MKNKDSEYKIYVEYFERTISEIDNEIPLYTGEDFNRIITSAKRRELKKRRNLLVAAVFSLFVISSSVFGGVSYYDSLKTKEVIAKSTSELVDSIFDEPFMPDVEYSYINERQSISDWLENLNGGNFILDSGESFNF